MNLKKVLMVLFTGFCFGGMVLAMLEKIGMRSASYGGEVLFLPCSIMLVWLGWTLNTEYQKLTTLRRGKNGNTRRK